MVTGETGPSGGPLMTDVLGICTSWADGRCTVVRESGELVTIAVADIVSGKPVPPRPSARQRVSVSDAERHSLPMWPRVERLALGAWELRFDPAPVGRLLKRANSCLALGDPGRPLPEAAEAVVAFYAERRRQPMVQVELDADIEHTLTSLGWEPVPGGDAHFLVASVAQALRVVGSSDGVELDEDGPRAHVVRRVGTTPSRGPGVASGRAALDDDWLGIHALGVEPHHRGYGHATAMVAALLEWGAEHGASTAWLHVETDNGPALAMYDKLGFRTHHTCRYLTAPN